MKMKFWISRWEQVDSFCFLSKYSTHFAESIWWWLCIHALHPAVLYSTECNIHITNCNSLHSIYFVRSLRLLKIITAHKTVATMMIENVYTRVSSSNTLFLLIKSNNYDFDIAWMRFCWCHCCWRWCCCCCFSFDITRSQINGMFPMTEQHGKQLLKMSSFQFWSHENKLKMTLNIRHAKLF